MSLRAALEAGQFVITTEVTPPRGVDTSSFMSHARQLQGKVDAINVTENQRALAHLGSIACCAQLVQSGIDAIMHLNCRDMNRLALQAHVLGGYALGIRNVLVIGGDPVKSGDQPETKEVYDLAPGDALGMCRSLTEGRDLAGNELNAGTTDLMIGAAANPTHPDLDTELKKTEAKVLGGATFFQTQGIYDVDRCQQFMSLAANRHVPVLAGIIPLRTAKMAELIKHKIPGTWVPDDVYERHLASDDMFRTALEFSVETVLKLRDVVQGVHIMTIGSRKMTEAIIDRLHERGIR
ncbi:MAG: hypothetical protein GEEBNDBF_00519 [bacterium]|nr:hypothetical protein [bacterium]